MSESDRELLELAAKAAGYEFSWGATPLIKTVDMSVNRPFTIWNPLSDDGDALRLAVKLGLTVAPANGINAEISECYRNSSLFGRSTDGRSERHNGDEYSATRRAIVRAAAEIGRQLKGE